MILYTPSILLGDYDTVTFDGNSTPELAFDNDKTTIAISTSADPTFEMDFGSGETRTADSIWLKSSGYTAVEIEHDGTSAGAFNIGSDGYLYQTFTQATAQEWKLNFTGTGSLSEAYLCNLILDFDTDDKRPYRWRMPRVSGTFYRAANAELLGYNPIGRGRTEIQLDWDLLDNESVADLKTAWESGFADNNFFSVYPVPTDRPRHFFQARWDSPFDFTYTGRRVQDGQSGQVVFTERDVRLGGV